MPWPLGYAVSHTHARTHAHTCEHSHMARYVYVYLWLLYHRVMWPAWGDQCITQLPPDPCNSLIDWVNFVAYKLTSTHAHALTPTCVCGCLLVCMFDCVPCVCTHVCICGSHCYVHVDIWYIFLTCSRSWIKVDGNEYKLETGVIIEVLTNDMPTIGVIKKIFLINGQTIFFV